ncbi:hypothetical protein [Clostridium putrefaciens]|nr:hypothetical protein [Clostridium putrefaciens]
MIMFEKTIFTKCIRTTKVRSSHRNRRTRKVYIRSSGREKDEIIHS